MVGLNAQEGKAEPLHVDSEHSDPDEIPAQMIFHHASERRLSQAAMDENAMNYSIGNVVALRSGVNATQRFWIGK